MRAATNGNGIVNGDHTASNGNGTGTGHGPNGLGGISASASLNGTMGSEEDAEGEEE
jgi:hypothetical protein